MSPLTKAMINSGFTSSINATLMRSSEAATALIMESYVSGTIDPYIVKLERRNIFAQGRKYLREGSAKEALECLLSSYVSVEHSVRIDI